MARSDDRAQERWVVAFRFRKSVKLMPGVRLNLSKSGGSVSLGRPGATMNFSSRGARCTFGVPGTGMSWSRSSSPSAARHRQQAGSGPARTIETSAQLVQAVSDPRTEVVYRGSGRRLSAAQLDAAHRRLADQERRAWTQAQVDANENELADVLACWRDMPTVPSAQQYAEAAHPQPFRFGEVPPMSPDLERERTAFQAQTRLSAEENQGPSATLRGTPWFAGCVIAAMSVLAELPSTYAVIGLLSGFTIGMAGWLGLHYTWRSRVRETVAREMAVEWPERQRSYEEQHRAAVLEHDRRRAAAEAAWHQQEEQRVAWVRRLLAGDIEAVHAAIEATLGDLDFAFETRTDVGLSDAETAYLNLDLPEIEDVIPETRARVLKDGRVQEIKRKKPERNQAYAQLATGLAFMMAAASFAAAPTLGTVHVAAYTQRKQRRSQAIGDDYVYEVEVPRELFAAIDVRVVDPLALMSELGAKWRMKSTNELVKIDPPEWVEELGAA